MLTNENAALLAGIGVEDPQTVSEFRLMRDTLDDLMNAVRREERDALAARVAVLEGDLAKANLRCDLLADSNYLAGVGAGWNAAQDADPNTALEKLQAGRTGHVGAYRAALDELVRDLRAHPTPEAVALHPATADLVRNFSRALAEKLAKAETKYGYSDEWRWPNGEDDCRKALHEHVAKGDPRDVAAYCAFMWFHGWSTSPTPEALARSERVEAERDERENLLLTLHDALYALHDAAATGDNVTTGIRSALYLIRSRAALSPSPATQTGE
jgi:hypothetical protein